MMTISAHNSDWIHGSDVGAMSRNLLNVPADSALDVASSNMKNSQIIRIGIVSTKTRGLLPSMADVGPVAS